MIRFLRRAIKNASQVDIFKNYSKVRFTSTFRNARVQENLERIPAIDQEGDSFKVRRSIAELRSS
jgi:hypothetical protein